MKKKLVIILLSSVMLLGGAVTAWADSQGGDPSKPVDHPANMGEYFVPNKAIQVAWKTMKPKTKQWYLDHPGPSLLFPFGIDVDKQQPIGYPTCLPAAVSATYDAVLPLPKDCQCEVEPLVIGTDVTVYVGDTVETSVIGTDVTEEVRDSRGK